LLRKLMEKNDPAYRSASFILAVMLERKRLLKVKTQTLLDGQRVFLYEHSASGDLFTIPDPNLQLNQLEEVQRLVAHLLEHGMEAPAAMEIAAGSTPPAPEGGSTLPDAPAPAAP
jgi:hypothetical protein